MTLIRRVRSRRWWRVGENEIVATGEVDLKGQKSEVVASGEN